MNPSIPVFIAILAVASAGGLHHGAALLHGGAGILEGPSSRTTIIGPEGSVISAVAPGGQIVTEEHVGALTASVESAPLIHAAAPLIHAAAPLVTHGHAGLVSHAGLVGHAELASHAGFVTHGGLAAHNVHGFHSAPFAAAPVVHPTAFVQHADTEVVLTGPSGTVTRAGAIHGYAEPFVAHAAPVHGHSAYGHHGLLTAGHGDVVVSGASGRILTNGHHTHHATHELAEDIHAW